MRQSIQLCAVWTVAALAVVPALPRFAHAWGYDGHYIVALLGHNFLNDKAKQNVKKLLAADTDPLGAKDLGGRALWADKFRSASDENKKATGKWHYVDIDVANPNFDAACYNHLPLDGAVASKGPADSCVADKIKQFGDELASPSTSKAECILAFKFVLHFVGDVHQPLHAAEHQKDEGGNNKKVFYAGEDDNGNNRTEVSSLHGYWDNVPETLAPIGSAVTKLTKDFGAKKPDWMKGTPKEWAEESFEKAVKFAYDLPKKQVKKKAWNEYEGKWQTGWGYRLSQTYEDNALTVVREQLAKGGMRLAMILNETIGTDTSCVTTASFP